MIFSLNYSWSLTILTLPQTMDKTIYIHIII